MVVQVSDWLLLLMIKISRMKEEEVGVDVPGDSIEKRRT